MDDTILLKLFGGNSEGLEYYKNLRDALSNVIEEEECTTLLCDPNDEVIRSRLNKSGYKYKAVLKTTEEIFSKDSGSAGFLGKQTALDGHDEDSDCESDDDQNHETMDQNNSSLFSCGQFGCTSQFSSVSAYESHYHTCHHFTCATCRRVFSSDFMLDVHIQENHDSYFDILSSRIDMYRCLVESCALKFRTQDLRKNHLVKEHKYPSTFAFHKPVGTPSKKEKSNTSGVDNGNEKMECQTLDSKQTASSALPGPAIQKGENTSQLKSETETKPRMVPSNICFGRGAQRSFQPRPGKNKKKPNQQIHSPME